MNKISIIVPAYNMAKYMTKCLDGIKFRLIKILR